MTVPGRSLCAFATTAIGSDAVKVAAYSTPSRGVGSPRGSMNWERSGRTVLAMRDVSEPSRLVKDAVTVVGTVPRFCTIIVVSQPPAIFATSGRETGRGPALNPE